MNQPNDLSGAAGSAGASAEKLGVPGGLDPAQTDAATLTLGSVGFAAPAPAELLQPAGAGPGDGALCVE